MSRLQSFSKSMVSSRQGRLCPALSRALEDDFDRIVCQMTQSGEAIDALGQHRVQKIARADDVIYAHHNVQKYSRRW
jgi:hypothetical protein